jgi:hypothetical protein
MKTMKNVLKNMLYVSVFALAGIIFQISCSNSDNSLTSTNTNLEKLVFARKPVGSTVALPWQIWTCNYDGTNMTQIPI